MQTFSFVTPTQIDRLDQQRRKLQEIQIRMSVVVYDRRSVRALIESIESTCTRKNEDLQAILDVARDHLDLCETFEEAENRARSVSVSDYEMGERLSLLLKEVYKSWSRWHDAQTCYMRRAAQRIGHLADA
jgi:hypothetical protein